MEILFRDTEGKAITTRDIGEALKEVEADQCETLFIHS